MKGNRNGFEFGRFRLWYRTGEAQASLPAQSRIVGDADDHQMKEAGHGCSSRHGGEIG
jgi:hypothetical protein